MYARILVPLDGSAAAERILPHVTALAERFGSTVTLVRAAPLPARITGEMGMPDALPADPTPILEAERDEAVDYLDGLAEGLRGMGLRVECEEPEGPPAEAIVACARRLGAELIAMTTQRRGALLRLIVGSAADDVLRHAPCPVLLVRADDAAQPGSVDGGREG